MESQSSAIPVEVYEQLAVKYKNLAKAYQDLKQAHAKIVEWNAQCYKKYRDARDSVHQWQAYIDKHQGKHATAAAEIPSSPPKQAAEKRTPLRVSSSQTTEADEEPALEVCEPSSNDEPLLVSTRSLKRKRKQSPAPPDKPVFIKQEDANSPQNPINILSEDFSSPEIKRQKLVRVETSDLDACAHRMDTPRKRRRDRGASEEVIRPIPLPVNTSSLSGGTLQDVQQLAEFTGNERSNNATCDPMVKARDFATGQGSNNTLRPRSINIPGNSRGSNIRHIANAKWRRDDPRKIAILSEDGENVKDTVTTPVHRALAPDDIKRRLGSLLDEPTPGRQPLSLQRPPATTTTPRSREARQSPKPNIYKGAIDARPHVPYKTPLGLHPPPPDPSPDEEPLRDRPWQSLHLEDFKINPKFMGTNYAFSETFRGREQRRCLVGCTRPECCGNLLRKTIEMGAAPSNKTDAEVLEAFLGRNHAQIMAAYSPQKRKDVLIQARTQALANQYGRHRQAYDRPRTPPGFWRTDMPSTQEAEQDRARAHEIYLQKVEERWREAMRDGGRWLFRDE